MHGLQGAARNDQLARSRTDPQRPRWQHPPPNLAVLKTSTRLHLPEESIDSIDNVDENFLGCYNIASRRPGTEPDVASEETICTIFRENFQEDTTKRRRECLYANVTTIPKIKSHA